MKYETQELLDVYKKHGTIVVGLDFDQTIFPLHTNDYILERCKVVEGLIIDVRPYITLCLWTVAADWSLKYKVKILEYMGIVPDYFNDSPIFPDPTVKKPIFNLLLDDKAGLNESIEILQEFFDNVQKVKQDVG